MSACLLPPERQGLAEQPDDVALADATAAADVRADAAVLIDAATDATADAAALRDAAAEMRVDAAEVRDARRRGETRGRSPSAL